MGQPSSDLVGGGDGRRLILAPGPVWIRSQQRLTAAAQDCDNTRRPRRTRLSCLLRERAVTPMTANDSPDPGAREKTAPTQVATLLQRRRRSATAITESRTEPKKWRASHCGHAANRAGGERATACSPDSLNSIVGVTGESDLSLKAQSKFGRAVFNACQEYNDWRNTQAANLQRRAGGLSLAHPPIYVKGS